MEGIRPDSSPSPDPRKPIRRTSPSWLSIFMDLGIRIPMVAAIMGAILAVIFFPYSTDAPLSVAEQAELRTFYATAYEKPTSAEPGDDSLYVNIAAEAAEGEHITQRVAEFAQTYGLADKKVLDIGAGRGYLQDVVNDYTGLDIS